MSNAMATASRLAADHPESVLPCPVCAATVKGANLNRHLGKVHPGQLPARSSPGRSWRGGERLIARPLVIVPVLAVVASLIWLELTGSVDEVFILSAAGGMGVGLILSGLVVYGAPLFTGRLSVSGEGFVLSHTLGLRRRRLGRVDRIKAGSAYDVRTINAGGDGASGGPTIEEAAGIYVELRSGRRYITVRCKQSTGFRKTWVGWEQAGRSRRWHIILDPADFVSLQYTLVDLGLLTLRPLATDSAITEAPRRRC
ncbi:MAG: hypothetical protein H0T99_12405 [Geodermatophilaceae bacterium]|nr:hypothetical protein [Geodermatophilaceae bacterium]